MALALNLCAGRAPAVAGGPAARKQYRRYDGYPRGTSDHGSSARLGAGCGLVVNFVQIPSPNERMLGSIEALAAKLVG
jgi:hypothetical protein